MIYVLEVGGAPLCRGRNVYAYADLDAATRAARTLRASVVVYGVRSGDHVPTVGGRDEEDAWRVAQSMQTQRDQARAELEDHMAGNAELRRRYDARDGETMHQWIARLYGGWRRWQRVLAQVRRMDGEYMSEELEP